MTPRDGDISDLAAMLESAIAERDGARREADKLRGLLARLARYEHTNSHSHEHRARWNKSNNPRIAGYSCARCHAFADAREALGGARWLSRADERLVEEGTARAEPYACTDPRCGCATLAVTEASR